MGYQPKLDVDGIAGPKTREAVRKFQSDNPPLAIDGIAGPKTLAALLPPPPRITFLPHEIQPLPPFNVADIAEMAKMVAVSQVGVMELTGRNDGPAVEAFLTSVGLPKGNPWCMAFLYWCYAGAAASLLRANPMAKTGHCLTQLARTKPELIFHEPQVNDVYIMDFGGGSGHTGIVTKVYSGGVHFDGIEGNTNHTGSANGNEVLYHTRKIATIKAFIRYI